MYQREAVPAEAFSIAEFCQAHRISRSKLYELMSDGLGPRTFRVGSRVLISREAATEWRRQMEDHNSSEVA